MLTFSQKFLSGTENLSDIGSLGHIKKGYKMTSLIKPDDSWDTTFQKKNIYVAFLGHFLCPSLDKGKMESVYSVHQ